MSWYSNQSELLDFAGWINSETKLLRTPQDVIDLLRRPWLWDNEHSAYALWKTLPPDSREARGRVVNAASQCEKITDELIQEIESLADREAGSASSFTELCMRLVLGPLPLQKRDEVQ